MKLIFIIINTQFALWEQIIFKCISDTKGKYIMESQNIFLNLLHTRGSNEIKF